MNYTQTFAISAAGMALERTRVEVATLNLANAHTSATTASGVYRPTQVVAQSSFANAIDKGLQGPTYTLVSADVAPRWVHDPHHPQADSRGMVAFAPVDTATEMLALVSASRAYEANLAAIQTTRSLAVKTLDIGGNT